MSLYVMSFGSPNELVVHVNDNAIPQADIQKITDLAGRWYLFWWA